MFAAGALQFHRTFDDMVGAKVSKRLSSSAGTESPINPTQARRKGSEPHTPVSKTVHCSLLHIPQRYPNWLTFACTALRR
jgi:hypothetical protein